MDNKEFFAKIAAEGLKPSLSSYVGTVYHGTILGFATNIVSTQDFIPSKSGRLGPGVYFYEHSSPLHGAKAGAAWVEHRPREATDPKIDPCNVRVVTAEVRIERMFDMLDKKNVAYLKRIYQLYAELIRASCPSELHRLNEQLIGKTVGEMSPEAPAIQAIRGYFKIPHFNVNQIGLVVRDKKCILNPRVYEELK